MPETTLPNQRRVDCPNPAEVGMLFKQIGPYFRHGRPLQAGDTVFDVGANIGLFSLEASAWGQRPLRGFAFEPLPALHASLARNLERHRAGLTPLHCGLGRQEGRLRFHYYPRATVLSTAHPQDLHSAHTRAQIADQLHRLPPALRGLARLPQGLRRLLVRAGMALFLRPQRVDCALRTLSRVIDEHDVARIDLLKIDAERAELEVLQGLRDEHWPRVQQVMMEVHDLDGRLALVRSLLQAHGLSRQVVEQGAAMRPFGIYQLWAWRETAPGPAPG